MKQFQIYVLQNNQQILLTDHLLQNKTTRFNATYGEQLTESENDQFSLTFSIAKKMRPSSKQRRVWAAQHVEVKEEGIDQLDSNPWLNVVKLGTKLQLILDQTKTINFIVSAVSPSVTKNNVVYNFTAQDECSYLWSKRNLGYFFPQTEEEEGAHNIVYFLQQILYQNHLSSEWSVSTQANTPLDLFSFSIDNSNTYNAIIEACNVLGYQIHIDYVLKHIIPYIPDKNAFSGYRYRPETNQKSLSVSYDSGELCTLLHVAGGEDAYGQNIPLVPALPQPFKQYFTLDEKWYDHEWSDVDGKKYYTTIFESMKTADEVSYDGSNWICGKKEPTYFLSTDTDILTSEIEECESFCKIADQVPYLGQFLCDFSFFKDNGLLRDGTSDTSKIEAQIQSILNRMRINNTWLKIYTPSYYTLLYEITKRNAQLEVYAEQYEAECVLIANEMAQTDSDTTTQADSDTTQNWEKLNEIVNSIRKIFNKEYFDLFRKVYGTNPDYYVNESISWYRMEPPKTVRVIKPRPPQSTIKQYSYAHYTIKLYPEWQEWLKKMNTADEQYELYNKKYTVAKAKLDSLEDTDTDELDPNKISLESEAALYNTTAETYKTLGTKWTCGDTTVPGKWSLLLSLMQQAYFNLKIDQQKDVNGLVDEVTKYEDYNKNQEIILYTIAGQFIYESSYENTDELDSVGLYNQAVQNFALYNKPQASYSLTTIDLECLQQIAVPNVTVGSKVRIYNAPLDLDDDKVNNLQYTNNEVIITAISRNLRSNDDVQLTVTKTNKIDTLVQKLLINIKEM